MDPHDPNSRQDPSGAQMRRERRFRCVVTPAVLHASGHPVPFAALILEVSKSGLRLRSARALAPGLKVSVSFENGKTSAVIQAETRFCQPGPDGYEIGLEIIDSTTTRTD